ncbi:MAG TPA: phosphotransferase [Pyrinomonadaceae bacterium]
MNTLDHNWMLAEDAFLPQRDLLLDECRMTRRFNQLLAKHTTLSVNSCTRLRTKYRVGVSLRVLYRVEIANRSHFIAARAFPTNRETQCLDFASGDGEVPSVFQDGRTRTVFWRFPNDRKIKHLDSLINIPSELSKIGNETWVTSRVVAHAPEKSVTAQCLNPQGNVVAYAKIYSTSENQRIRATYDSIRKGLEQNELNPAVPSVLAHAEDKNLLLLEAIEGRPLNTAASETIYSELGSALARLHQIELNASLPTFNRLTPKHLNDAAWTIARARPDVGWNVSELARILNSTYTINEAAVVLHGDVHAKNFLVKDFKVALIDLDQAGLGPAAADLGSFLASLHYDECIGQLNTAQRSAFERAFLCGYERVRPLPEHQSLTWHTAAALVAERAYRSVNRIRVEGLLHLSDVLKRAAEILNLRPI